jgi:hypothetical protein
MKRRSRGVSQPSRDPMNAMRPRLQRFLLGAAFGALLAFVFISYLRPDFVLDLANRIVLCL